MARKSAAAVSAALTQTPEFQVALAAAVATAMEGIASKLAEARGAEAPINLGDDAWARKLALAIAEISDQGSKRKRVAPEVMVSREEAHQRMINLIIDARAENQIPTYQLRHKVYLDEVFVDPVYIGADKRQHAQEIDWPGVPNHAMVPVNEVAQAIHAEFLTSVGSPALVPGESNEMRVTAGGLVVRGRPTGTQEAPQTGAGNPEVGLRVRRDAAARPGVAVLGTVHPAARSNDARQAR